MTHFCLTVSFYVITPVGL